MKESDIDFLKTLVVHTIDKEKIYTPLLLNTNKDIEELKKYFKPNEKNYLLYDKKDLLLEEKILRLGKMLYEERNGKESKIKYGSIKNKEIQKLTQDIRNFLLYKNDDNFKLDYQNFKNSLDKINYYFYKIYNDNSIKNINVDKTLIDQKNKYINNYIYNAIVNHAIYIYNKEIKTNSKIKEKDIIQEIIYKHYLKNKNQTRKNILKNYLSNTSVKRKYRNKKEIEDAIRNINEEMEEAQKEFSKLFINDNYVINNTIN